MLPRSKSRRITVESERYRFAVSEMSEPDGDIVPIAVTVQHEVTNGALLRITGLTVNRVPVNESKWYDGRTVARPITPCQIADLIVRAKQTGWLPEIPGPPFVLQVRNEDVSSQGASA